MIQIGEGIAESEIITNKPAKNNYLTLNKEAEFAVIWGDVFRALVHTGGIKMQ